MSVDNEIIKGAAEHYAERLVRRRRHDDTTYLTFQDASAATDELSADAHKAVDGPDYRFPDDWVFERMSVAFDALVSADGDVETAEEIIRQDEPFIYTADAFQWIGKNAYNQALVDEAASDYGADFGHSFTGHVVAIANAATADATVRIMHAIVEFLGF